MQLHEALTAAFGRSAERLDVSQLAPSWLDMDVHPFQLTINDKSGLQVVCGGGNVIGSFETTSASTTRTFYLIFDDSEGEKWDMQRARMHAKEIPFEHSYRPNERLRLVMSS